MCFTDPERFRFARETSFGRRHLSFWTKTPVFIWIVRPTPITPPVYMYMRVYDMHVYVYCMLCEIEHLYIYI